MAGNAARRIARSAFAAVLIGAGCLANAEWDNARFCRLGDDRLLISANSQKFILNHGAAWELVDPAQKPAFDKWLTKSKLSKDYGQLVAGLPTEKEVPLTGEFDVTTSSDGTNSLQFKHKGTSSGTVNLTAGSDGVRLDPASISQFEQIAKDLSKAPSTLLVLMSDRSGNVSVGKAWAAFLNRFASKPEFFIYLDKQHGFLWARKVAGTTSTPSTTIQESSPKTDPADTSTDEKAPKKAAKKSDEPDILPWIIGGVLAIATGLGGYFFGARGPRAKSPPNDAGPTRFVVSSSERELVEKVRDEIKRLRWDANHVPSGEEFVVGQMIDRYNGADALKKDVERLSSYRQFKEAHDAFQYQIDQAESEAKKATQKLAEASNIIQQERLKAEKLEEESRLAKAAHSTSAGQVKDAKKRIAELERKNSEFRQIYVELLSRTAAVCHDIVLTRPRGDAWALAFAYIVDYTLANLGLSLQSDDRRLYAAMLTNLARLSDAMSKSFPDRKLVIDPWQRAVKTFGVIQPPEYETKPHPHVDSLSQIVMTLRDTGPSLADFRELYAPSDSGLHIIRPA